MQLPYSNPISENADAKNIVEFMPLPYTYFEKQGKAKEAFTQIQDKKEQTEVDRLAAVVSFV